MEDIPEMKRQGLTGRAQIRRTSVIVKQRSAERQKNSFLKFKMIHNTDSVKDITSRETIQPAGGNRNRQISHSHCDTDD